MRQTVVFTLVWCIPSFLAIHSLYTECETTTLAMFWDSGTSWWCIRCWLLMASAKFTLARESSALLFLIVFGLRVLLHPKNPTHSLLSGLEDVKVKVYIANHSSFVNHLQSTRLIWAVVVLAPRAVPKLDTSWLPTMNKCISANYKYYLCSSSQIWWRPDGNHRVLKFYLQFVSVSSSREVRGWIRQ